MTILIPGFQVPGRPLISGISGGLDLGLGPQLPELLAVDQNEVHVLVERLERADEGPGVLQDDPHSVVEVLVHLVASSDRHFEGWGV